MTTNNTNVTTAATRAYAVLGEHNLSNKEVLDVLISLAVSNIVTATDHPSLNTPFKRLTVLSEGHAYLSRLLNNAVQIAAPNVSLGKYDA